MIRLLVVDDESDVCDFVKNFFKERDFDVYVAYDGKEALSIIDSKRPEIILLDIKMPVMDGMAVLKEMREAGDKSKVIMITAMEDAEKVDEARKHGVHDYITKPLLLEQLERTVLKVAEEIKMSR